MSEMVLGQDASFTEESFIKRYNSDLANDLGNMLSRAVKLTIKHFNGEIPVPGEMNELDRELAETAVNAVEAMQTAVDDMKLDKGLEQVMNVVRAANRYMEKTAPWTLAKNGDMNRLASVLYTASETLRIVSGLLMPVMPSKMAELRATLGINEKINTPAQFSTLNVWGGLVPGTKIKDIEALFPRIITEEPKTAAQPQSAKTEKKADKKQAAPAEKTSSEMPEGLVSIDEFFRTQLKTAKILSAEKVEGAYKLLKLQIEVGEEKRQLVAGIAKFYKPEDVVGRTIVIVANLKPAKIRGIESQGMLLAAKVGDSLKLVGIDGGDFPSGASVG